MHKSSKPSQPDASKLADEISTELSLASSSPVAASASQPSNEPPPSASSQTETQRIGSLTIPKWAWSAIWTHDESAVRMKLAGDLLEVLPQGRWEPPRPNIPRQLPAPNMGESHQAYYFRVLLLFKGEPHRPEIARWIATRKWAGQSAKQLRDQIAAGIDLPDHRWRFVQDKPSSL